MKAKLTSKGQITLPKGLRDRLGLRTGDEVEFVEQDGGFRVEKRLEESRFANWLGFLREAGGRDPDDLVEEMRGA
jgi:AbrB family looped-hinge helix DNA binding protein